MFVEAHLKTAEDRAIIVCLFVYLDVLTSYAYVSPWTPLKHIPYLVSYRNIYLFYTTVRHGK